MNNEELKKLYELLLIYLKEDGSYQANLEMTAKDILDDINYSLDGKDYEW